MVQNNDIAPGVFQETARSDGRSALGVGANYGQSVLGLVFGPDATTFSDGAKVRSILGLDTRDSSIKTFDSIISGAALTARERQMISAGHSPHTGVAYREMLAVVWKEAQIGGRDQGKDLQKLLPDLMKNPELLEKLYSVATASQLLSFNVSGERRSEFLVELIAAAADRRLLNQGHTSMCTVTKQFSTTSSANIIGVACDLVLSGEARLLSGEGLQIGRGATEAARHSDVARRLKPWAEGVSGHGLDDTGKGSIALSQIAARQPGPLMTLVLGSLMELHGGDVTKGDGQTWAQFSSSWRSMSGHESVCHAYDAQVQVDAAGKPVWNFDASGREVAVAGARSVTPVEYVDLTLARKAQETVESPPRGILVNLRWADAEPSPGKVSKHSCHTLLVVGKEVGADGSTWYVLENPVGSYMKAGPDGNPRLHGEGAILGDTNATWWKEGSNGLVRVRADVFKESVIHFMVDHVDRPFNGSQPLRTVGNVNGTADGAYETYTPHVVQLRTETQTARADDRKPVDSGVRQETVVGLAQDSVERAMESRKRPTQPDFGVSRAFRRKEDDEIVRDYDDTVEAGLRDAQKRREEGAFYEPSLVGFGQSSAPAAVPPLPPTESPLERAQRKLREDDK
jgi:hypothetical protein